MDFLEQYRIKGEARHVRCNEKSILSKNINDSMFMFISTKQKRLKPEAIMNVRHHFGRRHPKYSMFGPI